MIRIIFGTYKEELTKAVRKYMKLEKEIESLNTQLSLQTKTDVYRDDLIDTTQKLLISKEKRIEQLQHDLVNQS